MDVIRIGLVVLGLAFFLAACNTTDALTPQVDVGGGLSPTTPLTQADTERLARAPQPATGGQLRNNADASGQTGQWTQPAGTQNTLQAQADALARGNQPVEAQDTRRAEPAQDGQADAEQTLRTPESQRVAQPAATANATPATTGTVRFLPIIGAPVQAVTPLSRQLGTEARNRGLTIKSSSDTSSDHILKGYFSAFSDGGKVTVIYVWDVLDNAGTRLHRIQGQETLASTAAEPWAAVPAAVMQQIATKTMDEYAGWRQSHGQ